jgi:hypothetical protein
MLVRPTAASVGSSKESAKTTDQGNSLQILAIQQFITRMSIILQSLILLTALILTIDLTFILIIIRYAIGGSTQLQDPEV